MSGVLVYLFWTLACCMVVWSQETTTTQTQTLLPADTSESAPTTSPSSSTSASLDNTVSIINDFPITPSRSTSVVPLETTSGVYVSQQDNKMKNKVNYKPLFFHILSPNAWLKGLHDKWVRFKEFLATSSPSHANFENQQPIFNPQQIWEKIHEKNHHSLTGIYGAVYGLAPLENHDYPFAYRGLEKPVSNRKAGRFSNRILAA